MEMEKNLVLLGGGGENNHFLRHPELSVLNKLCHQGILSHWNITHLDCHKNLTDLGAGKYPMPPRSSLHIGAWGTSCSFSCVTPFLCNNKDKAQEESWAYALGVQSYPWDALWEGSQVPHGKTSSLLSLEYLGEK